MHERGFHGLDRAKSKSESLSFYLDQSFNFSTFGDAVTKIVNGMMVEEPFSFWLKLSAKLEAPDETA
jgi:hypothetical protein